MRRSLGRACWGLPGVGIVSWGWPRLRQPCVVFAIAKLGLAPASVPEQGGCVAGAGPGIGARARRLCSRGWPRHRCQNRAVA